MTSRSEILKKKLNPPKEVRSPLHNVYHEKFNKELGPRTAKFAQSISLKLKMIDKVPTDFMSVIMTSSSNRFLHYDVIKSVIITEIRLLCCNKNNQHIIFLKFHIRPILRSNFWYYRGLERFKMKLIILKVFGSRGWATKILTMICAKMPILARSEDWTNMYAWCSFKIINNECVVYIVTVWILL